MTKYSKPLGLYLALLLTLGLLAACGDATNTSAPAAATTGTSTTAAAMTNAAAMTTAAGGATTAASSGGTGSTALPAAFTKANGCKNVGVLLPETDSSPRWEANDRPLLEKGLKDAGFTVQYNNANNNADTQQNQADAALTKGACILVVGAKDSQKASAIVQKAKSQGVPVIAYDRLIQDNDLAYYVSFDNVKVGELQGQYIVDHHKKGDKVSMINGSQTDNNAILFNQGAMSKLKPLFDSGELVKVYDQFTPDWNNATAQSEMEAALQKTPDINIAYVANDGMANTVIAALKAKNLNGKVLVTGQDATVPGIQNILTGDQAMTVYKAIPKEAQATIDLVKAISGGQAPSSTLINGATKTQTGGNIPSSLQVPVTVSKDNVASTVIADGFVKKEDVCKGLSADAGKGIC